MLLPFALSIYAAETCLLSVEGKKRVTHVWLNLENEIPRVFAVPRPSWGNFAISAPTLPST